MKSVSRLYFVLSTCMLTTLSATVMANEDIRVSGYGTLIAGTVIEGDGYFARMPDSAGQYVDGIEIKTESRLGIQANYRINSDLDITGQVMFRGINEFEPELEWLYATYSITPESKIKVGQMRLPVYHFSDYMDVGVAYPWLRIPSDPYSLAFTNYQGANLDYNLDFGSGTTLFRVYFGQESTDPNDLITTISQYKTQQQYNSQGQFTGVAGIVTTKDYKDLVGVVVDTTVDMWGFRASYLSGKELFAFYLEGNYPSNPAGTPTWSDTEFLDVSIQYDSGDVLAIAEWNKYTDFYKSWFASLAYRYEQWTPYIFYSEFSGVFKSIAPGGISAGYEDSATGTLDDKYSTVGIGARYNLTPYAALKFEYLSFTDDGDAAVFIDQNQDGTSDSQALFVALDFSF